MLDVFNYQSIFLNTIIRYFSFYSLCQSYMSAWAQSSLQQNVCFLKWSFCLRTV